MLSGQLKCSACVDEGMTVGVDPIVATKAVVSISCKVCLHEIGLDQLVAIGAHSLVELRKPADMAGLANKRGSICLLLVGGERIPKHIVRGIDHGKVCKRGCCPSMIRVAVSAGHPGLFYQLISVQAARIILLDSHIGMAGYTPVSHGRRLPESNVAGRAIIG
jgi:hypothetical protein